MLYAVPERHGVPERARAERLGGPVGDDRLLAIRALPAHPGAGGLDGLEIGADEEFVRRRIARVGGRARRSIGDGAHRAADEQEDHASACRGRGGASSRTAVRLLVGGAPEGTLRA